MAAVRRRLCGRGHGWWLWTMWKVVYLLCGIWIIASLLRTLRRTCLSEPAVPQRDEEVTVPAHVYRQPDPMIYDQYYLDSFGLAFSWDNPDISVERPEAPGVPVDAHTLTEGTPYVLIARVWNGSGAAPAVDMPVQFSYLDFGIGTTKVPIGQTTVDLPVKAADGCPAFAHMPWTTPSAPGHYCLQVELLWPDDANPHNNLGQHNLDVQALNSPTASFTFALRNDGFEERTLRLEVDSYVIPAPPSCDEAPDRDRRRLAHLRDDHGVPEGWNVTLDATEHRLLAGEQRAVSVVVTAPDGFSGGQTFNVNAFAGATLVGGVTLHAEGDADD